jgi:hypothetical protein
MGFIAEEVGICRKKDPEAESSHVSCQSSICVLVFDVKDMAKFMGSLEDILPKYLDHNSTEEVGAMLINSSSINLAILPRRQPKVT